MGDRLAMRRRVGGTGLALPPMGFGAAHLGGMYRRVGGEEARATIEAAWSGGLRYFDTAPFYGRGLSEHRLGDVLIDKPRAEFVVTTKVGRVFFRPDDPAGFDRRQWGGGLNFEFRFDYSYDGIMRSYEQSLFRLGLDTVDALLIHDPDAGVHGEMFEPRMKDMRESGMRALEELKRNGDIKAIGMGLNAAASLETIAPMVDLDFLIVAMAYTLLDQGAVHAGLGRCLDEGIAVIVGAPYASGILATGPGPQARYGYQIAPEPIQRRVARIAALCAEHGVSLQSAALRFPLGHPAVAAVIPGGASPAEVEANIAHFTADIPPALWTDLRDAGLIDPDAPVPAAP